MNDSHEPLKGALWASAHAQHKHQPMGVFIAAAVVVTVLMIYGLTHINFAPVQAPPKEMRVTMAPPPPPPPPPPPEVKKIEPPPAPTPVEKPKPAPVKPRPLPTPKPPPAKPAPVPKEANIPAAANPAPNAPALATAPANTTPAAPVAAAAAPTPAPAPGLHGVVDGRGHCQSVQPQIPRKALQDGISATVTARLSIGTDGQVSDVKIMRVSPPTSVFNDAVIAAGKGYKCEKNPEPYVGEVQFSFKTTASDDE